MTTREVPAADAGLFEGGPPHQLLHWLRVVAEPRKHRLRHGILAVAVMWLPLVVLTAIRGDLLGIGPWNGFIFDYGAQTRFLIVPPLLVLAEALCPPRLAALAGHFVRSSLVGEADFGRYREAVRSTISLSRSIRVELIAIILAYAFVATVFYIHPPAEFPHWYGEMTAAGLVLFPAGWWAALISVPLLVLLQFAWIWRLFLWARFLWLMNRLDLRLVAAHPDHAGGLRFLQYSVRAFAPLAFALGMLAAGPIVNRIVHGGQSGQHFKYVVAAAALTTVVLFVAPLLVFIRRLADEQQRGVYTYGALAIAAGHEMEHRWTRSGAALGKEALASPEFSATIDLYSVVANVYAMRILPLELKTLLVLIGASLLPFVPVLLLSMPFEVILKRLAGVFF
jgi:hypothetical protein